MERENEKLLEKQIVRLNEKLLGTVMGVLLGLGLFVVTNALVLKGGARVGPHLALLSEFFPGYRVTFLGSLIGFLYAFVAGFVIGTAVGAVYNKIARV